MAELTATAVAMINSSVEQVLGALVDYESVRPLLLPDNFDDYQVLAGGQGAGTEVSWTLLVGDPRPRRFWQLGRPKREPWDCLVQIDEAGENQIVERDTRTELVTTWTVHEAGEGRTAVRVLATWPGPDGLPRLFTRSQQQLALRTIYEDILTRLHEHFEPPKVGRRGKVEAVEEDEAEEASAEAVAEAEGGGEARDGGAAAEGGAAAAAGVEEAGVEEGGAAAAGVEATSEGETAADDDEAAAGEAGAAGPGAAGPMRERPDHD